MMMMITTTIPLLLLLLFIVMVLALSTVPAESFSTPNPSNNKPSNKNPPPTTKAPLSLEDFEFAPNGVCISPEFFVCELSNEGDKTLIVNGDKANHNHNNLSSQSQLFTLRNVPGTGDCMFQAVVLASLTSMGLGGNDVLLRAISRETRAVVAQILQSNGTLFVEGNRIVSASSLLKSAAKAEGLLPGDYLSRLKLEGREGGLYGGGPELTVLSNVLRRPISIYEVSPSDNSDNDDNKENETNSRNNNLQYCPIQCQGVFGLPQFADPCSSIPSSAVLSGLQPGAYSWHLHILVVDTQTLGEKHACVLLPQ